MKIETIVMNLQLFADLSASTKTDNLTATMKDFYDTSLLENAREASVLNQFAKIQPMTHGKSLEWRRFETFMPALSPLTEGVIPSANNLRMTSVYTDLKQYGSYVSVSDVLEMTAYDDIIFGATEEMGAAAGATDDLWTMRTLSANTNMICAKEVSDYNQLGEETYKDALLTPALINKAVTWLKKMKTPRINGYYVCLIHPSVAEDLRESVEWKDFHKYNAVEKIFKGEIGELHGCKFVECDITPIYPWDAGDYVSIYSTIVFGKDAFGKAALDGGGLELIVHSKEEIGGPLNQFSTIGYKFMHGAAVLYPERMVEIMTRSTYNDPSNV